jgi:excisionase family DNA binding protein
MPDQVSYRGEHLSAHAFLASGLLTKKQAAEYLQVTPRYIERAVRNGLLRALKPTGKLWRVRKSSLDAFLESGATSTEDV